MDEWTNEQITLSWELDILFDLMLCTYDALQHIRLVEMPSPRLINLIKCWHNEWKNKVKLFLAVREIDMFLNIVMIVFLVSARAEYEGTLTEMRKAVLLFCRTQYEQGRQKSTTEFILSIKVFGM